MNKVQVGLLALILGVTILLSSAASVLGEDEIRIGMLAPVTGMQAKLSKDMERGFRLYFDEAGWTINGRPVKLLIADTEFDPKLGPAKAKELVEDKQVHMLTGVIHSGVAMAIRDYVVEKQVPFIIANAGAPQLTASRKSPFILRVSYANGQQDLAGGWYAYNKFGFRKMILVASDFGPGHDKVTGFKKYFTAAGGKIVKEIYIPLKDKDLSPYVEEAVKAAPDADGTWVFLAGPPAIGFLKLYDLKGLKRKVPLFVESFTVDDALLPAMGKAAAGVKNYSHYSVELKNEANKKFVDAYSKRYRENPSMFSEQAYVAAKVISTALKEIGGAAENKEDFLAAARKVAFLAPRGPISFDENQNVIENVYIRKVFLVKGKMLNIVMDVVPNVDQNWKPQ